MNSPSETTALDPHGHNHSHGGGDVDDIGDHKYCNHHMHPEDREEEEKAKQKKKNGQEEEEEDQSYLYAKTITTMKNQPLMLAYPNWDIFTTMRVELMILGYILLMSLIKPIFNYFTLQYAFDTTLQHFAFVVLQSILPMLIAVVGFLACTALPPMKKYRLHYTKLAKQLQQQHRPPPPPPAFFLTHYLMGLLILAVVDTCLIPLYQFHNFYHLYSQPDLVVVWKPIALITLASFFQLLFGVVIITLCIIILFQCKKVYEFQATWCKYIERFQNKYQCFVLGHYTQTITQLPSLAAFCGTYIMFIRFHIYNYINILTTALKFTHRIEYTAFPFLPINQGKYDEWVQKKYTKHAQKVGAAANKMAEQSNYTKLDQDDGSDDDQQQQQQNTTTKRNTTNDNNIKKINCDVLPPYLVDLKYPLLRQLFDRIVTYFMTSDTEQKLGQI